MEGIQVLANSDMIFLISQDVISGKGSAFIRYIGSAKGEPGRAAVQVEVGKPELS